jgi:hypothetical protein
VIVPVAGVGGVPVTVVHVVGVVAVGHGDVAALGTMHVVMTLMGRVSVSVLAFVHVVAVNAVDVAVVGVVGVVAMRHGDVAAALAVGMRVIGVRGVLNRGGHAGRSSLCLCVIASVAPSALVPASARGKSVVTHTDINI